MRGVHWLALSMAAGLLVAPSAASGDPKPHAQIATVRILEGTQGAQAEVSASVERFEITKRLSWRGSAEDAVYVGAAESALKMKLHVEGGQAGAEMVGTLFRASEEDPTLARPPMISVSTNTMVFRGVVESLATSCDAKQCEAELTVIRAQRALARAGASSDDPARSPGF